MEEENEKEADDRSSLTSPFSLFFLKFRLSSKFNHESFLSMQFLQLQALTS